MGINHTVEIGVLVDEGAPILLTEFMGFWQADYYEDALEATHKLIEILNDNYYGESKIHLEECD